MSARKGITYLLGSNLGTFAIQFAGSVAIARLLSPAELGVYAAAMALVWIINGMLNVGLPGYLVRERDMPRDKWGTVLTLTFAQSLFFIAVLLIGAWGVGALAHDHRVTVSVRILAWYGGLMPFETTLLGLMQRHFRFRDIALISLVNVGASAVATIFLATQGYSWRAMPLGTGLGVTVALLIAVYQQRREVFSAPLSRAYLKPILDYGSRVAGASAILNVTNRLPDILLTRAQGAAATGLFNRGANLVDTFNNTVLTSFTRVMGSQMARDRDTPAGIGPVYAQMSLYVTGLFWPAFAVLAVLSGPIVFTLFGAKWMSAAPVMAIIALSGAINMIVANRMNVLIVVRRERDLPRLELIRGVIGVVLFTIAAYAGGLLWAAFTRVIDALIAVVLYSPGIHAATRLRYATLLRGFARSAIVAGITVTPALVLMQLSGWPQHLPFVQLAGIGLASALAWVLAVFVTRHELAAEVARAAGFARAWLVKPA
jgi:O-antigen/teichoic acid export membrane protein